MTRLRRMRIDEGSIVSIPTAAASAPARSVEAGPAPGSYRRIAYASVSRSAVAAGWKASFMSV
jgi:hypothetical protein